MSKTHLIKSLCIGFHAVLTSWSLPVSVAEYCYRSKTIYSHGYYIDLLKGYCRRTGNLVGQCCTSITSITAR